MNDTDRLEVDESIPGDWRHFTATRLDELGISEAVVGAILGHSSGKNVTRRYTHATLEAMREALTQLEASILEKAA